jgi:hypothetical protein
MGQRAKVPGTQTTTTLLVDRQVHAECKLTLEAANEVALVREITPTNNANKESRRRFAVRTPATGTVCRRCRRERKVGTAAGRTSRVPVCCLRAQRQADGVLMTVERTERWYRRAVRSVGSIVSRPGRGAVCCIGDLLVCSGSNVSCMKCRRKCERVVQGRGEWVCGGRGARAFLAQPNGRSVVVRSLCEVSSGLDRS